MKWLILCGVVCVHSLSIVFIQIRVSSGGFLYFARETLLSNDFSWELYIHTFMYKSV